MSDFSQAGLIATLHRLNEGHVSTIEKRLEQALDGRKVTVALPCHRRDLFQAPLRLILVELAEAAWVGQVILAANGLSPSEAAAARALLAGYPSTRLLWTDDPRLSEILSDLTAFPRDSLPYGKGLNLWAAVGATAQSGASTPADILVFQDSDVASFDRPSLARLCLACALPELPYFAAKMYYSRATDRLYGRVTRLFFGPFLQALVRVLGHHPLFDFLLAFRYPLAGECALRRSVAEMLPMHAGWGFEAGLLCALHSTVDPRELCQVEGGAAYDHKHQPAGAGLQQMAREIACTLLVELRGEGLDLLGGGTCEKSISAAYANEAQHAVDRSAALAWMNDLPFDRSQECALIESFSAVLAQLPGGPRPSVAPPWAQVRREKATAVAAFQRQALGS